MPVASAVSGILGAAQDLSSGDIVYTSRLSVKTQPWLVDHVIYGTAVVPGATYASMALAALGAPARLREVFFYEPIILRDKNLANLQLTLRSAAEGDGQTFEVHSRPYGDRESLWSLNAGGAVGIPWSGCRGRRTGRPMDSVLEKLKRIQTAAAVRRVRRQRAGLGATWCSSLKSLWVGVGEAVGDIAVGAELAEHLGTEPIHPVLLDLCTGVAGRPCSKGPAGGGCGIRPVSAVAIWPASASRERMPLRFDCRRDMAHRRCRQ